MILRINTPKDKEGVISYISRLPDNIRFTVAVNKVKEKRSIRQNSLYWLWIEVICDYTGYERNEAHDYLSERYLPLKSKIVFGVMQEKPVSTTTLNTEQFTKYLNQIEIFAAREIGIVLPRPEDIHFQEAYDKYQYAI